MIILCVTITHSSEIFNIEIRPIVCKYTYNTSEPLIIMTFPNYYTTYNKTQQEIFLFGSEISLLNTKHIPLKLGIGFFYGDKNPIYSGEHPGSVLDGVHMKFYLFNTFCEYQRKIIGIINGSANIKITTPYIMYDNELTKSITINFNPHIDITLLKWLAVNFGLDYRLNDLTYKKIYACYDEEEDEGAFKLYSTVKVDRLNYQVGLSFTF